MTTINQEALIPEIRLILESSDLESLSRKMVRKQLEEKLGQDMMPYKGFINETILKLVEEIQATAAADDEEEEEEEEKVVKPKGKRGEAFNKPLALSPELAQVLGIEEISRPQLVKMMWEYIRKHDLQDPSNKRMILLDESMKKVFQRDYFTMFTMNKFIKRHVRKPEELAVLENGWESIPRDGESSEEDTSKEKKPRKKRKREKVKRAPNPNSGIHKLLQLSDELACVVGEKEMSRPQVVKKVWEYIKQHELQNPENKREIVCDAKLSSLFGGIESVNMFAMQKCLKPHFLT